MTKKKNNFITIIPAFILIGTAVGVQTKNMFVHATIGLVVGIAVYFFFRNRNSNS